MIKSRLRASYRRGRTLTVTNAPLDQGGTKNFMEHLDCFAPGMLMLGAETLEKDLLKTSEIVPKPDVNLKELNEFRELAADLAQTCYDMYRMTESGLAPERTEFVVGSAEEVTGCCHGVLVVGIVVKLIDKEVQVVILGGGIMSYVNERCQ